MSCSDVFAEPILDTNEYLNKYVQQLVELDKKGLLPKLDKELQYKVYSIKGREFGAHKSIVLTTDDEHFVTVELGFKVIDGVKRIYPATRSLPKTLKPKMQYLGTITAKGNYLIAKAVAVMRHFGSYFKFCNNCQDYCNKYAAAIGLEGAQSMTDSDKVKLTALVAAILVFLIAVMR
ncbi:uncharacterized protein LOC114961047 [Acropora millepora]|uniref:uncharacterized protein LOC114961047 n=1 Tax=Acropora millepora TaxID=45264 RepID=UPI001CF4D5F1|nr:uncharacterized protein LOC114961047 [Acropora millepora]